jgi:hypothetical protein
MAREKGKFDQQLVMRAQGAFNVVNGLWPLLHLRSFEAVFGRKTDHWLVRTVAGLLLVVGVTQLGAGADAASIRTARRIGVGTSLVLGSIDVIYAPRRRISRLYLLDALAEGTLIAAWLTARAATPYTPRRGRSSRRATR